jgi:hypothetical protein
MKKITGPQAKKLMRMQGGTQGFLQYLGLKDTHSNRVAIMNWRARGIPAATILEHYDQLKPLYERLPRRNRPPTRSILDTLGADTAELV